MSGIESRTSWTGASFQEHRQFWGERLGSLDDDFHFRQTWQSFAEGGTGRREIEIQLTQRSRDRVRALSKGREMGLFVVVASALGLVMHRYTQSNVVHLETPCLRGGGPDAEPVIPLIDRFSWDWTVKDYLGEWRRLIESSYNFQAFPVTRFCEQSLDRQSRPASNVWLQFDAVHSDVHRMGDFDLGIRIVANEEIRLQVSAKAELFREDFLNECLGRVEKVFAAYENVEQTLKSIEWVAQDELEKLVGRLDAVHPLDPSIPALFERQAKAKPEWPAVITSEGQISFSELDQPASQLAEYLRTELKIQREDVVGVVCDRSERLIIALLGILKVGAVYLPVDSEYPEERIRYMLEDSGAKAVLMHSDSLSRLMTVVNIPMFALDLQLPTLDRLESPWKSDVSSDTAAYIIYTSGSTGKPKGVVVEHGAFINTVLHHIGEFDLQDSDRFSQFYGCCFDSSLFEIFVSLLSGTSLVMASRETIADSGSFCAFLEEHRVTTLTVPPVYLSTLDRERLSTVKRIVSAGDNANLGDALFFGQTRDYYNSYGPTEAAVCVTHHLVDSQRGYGGRIPIGAGISGVSLYVLDENLAPMPPGARGEICIGGVALARGYLNRQELTESRFVPSPLVEGERIYRTGDWGVWLPNGELELSGREDGQVKIRGFRIELGEVEAALARATGVVEVAVLAREDVEGGGKQLVGYLTVESGTDPDSLRGWLELKLPKYMIPSRFVFLDSMPMTANGKIDRKALESKTDGESVSEGPVEAPQTPMQERLLAIWTALLGSPRVGIDDNFFKLGGDSILVLRMVAQASQEGIRLETKQVFEHQTIAELAEVVGEIESIQISQEPVVGDVKMLPIQKWFFAQGLSDPHHFNQSVITEVPADFQSVAGKRALKALIGHHDALRLRFKQEGADWRLCCEGTGEEASWVEKDLGQIEASEQREICEREGTELQSGLGLEHGPLIRVLLLRFGPSQPALLLMAIHHLVVDGVSWRVLIEDFYTVYQSYLRERSVELPSKTTSLQRWAEELERYAREGELDRGYWLESIMKFVPCLPVDHEGGIDCNTVESSLEHVVRLSVDDTKRLLKEVPAAYGTQINEVLLTALGMTICEWTGEERFRTDLEGHGREAVIEGVDLSRTVGWLTSLFPVVIEIDSSADLGTRIKSVKERLREIPNRGLDFGVLRYLTDFGEIYRDELKAAESALLFNYLGQVDGILGEEADWKGSDAPKGRELGAVQRRTHLLEIVGIVEDGSLRMTWSFSEAVHKRETIERLAEKYMGNLRSIIEHCEGILEQEFTPSDFPAARVKQGDLDALAALFNS